ncbi:MAG TPA: YceH family protein [Candidatus Acidoferrales bacterium]|nr:YceH family protein [Candidatus Acidoferrales bacterium]
MNLTETEARVLGALIEKDVTTPDYYPLSLNALVNACNQKNNREPVMNLDEDTVREALGGLERHRLAGQAHGADSRVPKFEHRLGEVFNFTRAETAVICVLLLRGPQTPGELRGRTERLFKFEDLSSVQGTLQRLMQREEPLVKPLPKLPGTKEIRYMHLLSGDAEPTDFVASTSPSAAWTGMEANASVDRITQLEDDVRALKSELERLRQEFADFRKQFQ